MIEVVLVTDSFSHSLSSLVSCTDQAKLSAVSSLDVRHNFPASHDQLLFSFLWGSEFEHFEIWYFAYFGFGRLEFV